MKEHGASKTHATVPRVKVTKKADDPLGVVRVSLGGSVAVGGHYCVYRGNKQDAILCIREALRALEAIEGEPSVSPDDGKQYA